MEAAAAVSAFGARRLRQRPRRPALAGMPPMLMTRDARSFVDPAPAGKAAPLAQTCHVASFWPRTSASFCSAPCADLSRRLQGAQDVAGRAGDVAVGQVEPFD